MILIGPLFLVFYEGGWMLAWRGTIIAAWRWPKRQGKLTLELTDGRTWTSRTGFEINSPGRARDIL